MGFFIVFNVLTRLLVVLLNVLIIGFFFYSIRFRVFLDISRLGFTDWEELLLVFSNIFFRIWLFGFFFFGVDVLLFIDFYFKVFELL